MTLREFALYHKGHSQLLDRQMQQLAWHAANIMNCWVPKGKPRITVQKLLPRSPSVRDKQAAPTSLEEAKARAQRGLEDKELSEVWSGEKGKRLKDYLGQDPQA
jgi:L-rhamnose isomerase